MKELTIIAGPCVVESLEVCVEVAMEVRAICKKLGFNYIFKSSFKKANRTKLDSFTGLEEKESLGILKAIKQKLKISVLTDIHEVADIDKVKDIADYIQIPAFLRRQTDLLLAAGRSRKYVNIKKGQFVSPEGMRFAIEKVRSTGNKKVMVTERGTIFGYQDLIVDFRSVPIMKKFKVPVIVDCTHSLQKPNQSKGTSGGDPEMVATLCKAAVAVGADGLFIETHPAPKRALSDGESMISLDKMDSILKACRKIKDAIK